MKDLIVQRYNIVTVHRHGEMYDELREKPDGSFCYYKEANESHKEVLAEYSEPVNEELLAALQLIISYHDDGNCELHSEDVAMARAAISKVLGEE